MYIFSKGKKRDKYEMEPGADEEEWQEKDRAKRIKTADDASFYLNKMKYRRGKYVHRIWPKNERRE